MSLMTDEQMQDIWERETGERRELWASEKAFVRAVEAETIRRVREACAVRAWTHYMDTCKRQGIAPVTFEQFIASDAIRALWPEVPSL